MPVFFIFYFYSLVLFRRNKCQWGSCVLLPFHSKRWLIPTFRRERLAGRWARGKATRKKKSAPNHRSSRSSFARTSGVTFQVVWVYSRDEKLSSKLIKVFSFLRRHPFSSPRRSLSPPPSLHSSKLRDVTHYFGPFCAVLSLFETFSGMWRWFVDNPWQVVCFDIPTGSNEHVRAKFRALRKSTWILTSVFVPSLRFLSSYKGCKLKGLLWWNYMMCLYLNWSR